MAADTFILEQSLGAENLPAASIHPLIPALNKLVCSRSRRFRHVSAALGAPPRLEPDWWTALRPPLTAAWLGHVVLFVVFHVLACPLLHPFHLCDGEGDDILPSPPPPSLPPSNLGLSVTVEVLPD